MIKRFVLSFVVLGAVLGASAPAAAAGALLRAHVLVDGPTVTLGDLFDNVGDRANIQVLHAPPPGTHITVDTDWLTHVALVNNVMWKPRDLFDEAVIERTGLTIGHDQLLTALQAALVQRGAPADAGIELESRTQQMIVATDQSAQLSVRDLFYDRPGNRFSATMVAGESKLMVAGKLYPTIEVPVPTHAIPRGEIVMAQDISMTRIRQDQLRQGTILDAGALVGMAAKVALRPSLPVPEADLQRPVAVSRGALVTLVLNYNGMELIAQGRAIDQGSLGDSVRATNTHSNITVEGIVDGTNRVRVQLNGRIALAN